MILAAAVCHLQALHACDISPHCPAPLPPPTTNPITTQLWPHCRDCLSPTASSCRPLMLQAAYAAGRLCCRPLVLRAACAAGRLCCRPLVLQAAYAAGRLCCRPIVLQAACAAGRLCCRPLVLRAYS